MSFGFRCSCVCSSQPWMRAVESCNNWCLVVRGLSRSWSIRGRAIGSCFFEAGGLVGGGSLRTAGATEFELLHGCCQVWVCGRTRCVVGHFLGRSCCYIIIEPPRFAYSLAQMIPVALASLKGDHFAKKPQSDKEGRHRCEKGASRYPLSISKTSPDLFYCWCCDHDNEDDRPDFDVVGVEATNIQAGRLVRRSLPNRIKGACEHQYIKLHKAGWIPPGRRWKGWQHWTLYESKQSLLSIGQLKASVLSICCECMRQKWMTRELQQSEWNLIYDLTSRDTMTQLLSQ